LSQAHIVLCCATERGNRVLRRLRELEPTARLTVFSFRETTWEPPFLENIRRTAQESGAVFFEQRDVGAPEFSQFWTLESPTLLLAVNWRYIISPTVYSSTKMGAYVFHDSLLPLYRGFSPTVRAMINGEDRTGATLFAMAERVDEGDIVDQIVVPIGPSEAIAQVTDKVTVAYLELLGRNLPALLAGTAHLTPQDHAQATYYPRRSPEENEIDWSQSARQIKNLIRAVGQPYSGAYTNLTGATVLVWEAGWCQDSDTAHTEPGTVTEVIPGLGATVETGDGTILLTMIQFAGSTRTRADTQLTAGMRLGP
jgi:methionyl-tRNA formyltransferase